MNGSSCELSKLAVEGKDKKADEVLSPPPKGPVVPPSASVSPRPQNPGTTEPTIKEDKGPPLGPSRDISKEPETKEKTVSDTMVYCIFLISLCIRYFVSRSVFCRLFGFLWPFQ